VRLTCKVVHHDRRDINASRRSRHRMRDVTTSAEVNVVEEERGMTPPGGIDRSGGEEVEAES
jgi:hypothetical protein